jgi:Cu/Ag efflux pump CusA
MLPLMLVPGSGSELYRGMAAVIVGGMLVSALFTLVLLPSLLRMNEERQGLAFAAAKPA